MVGLINEKDPEELKKLANDFFKRNSKFLVN